MGCRRGWPCCWRVAVALIHRLGDLYAFPIFAAVGPLYASIYLRPNNLGLVIVLHAFYNMTAMLVPPYGSHTF